jgi:hypothetical protein
MHIELYEGAEVLKIEESESELLCTDSTALVAGVNTDVNCENELLLLD